MKIFFFITVIFLGMQLPSAFCQDIEDFDREEIKERATDVLSYFEFLLNEIANPDTRMITVRDRIWGSYGRGDGSPHIFYDSAVIIEDDLHPSAYASTYEKDVPVLKYLEDFALYYEKSYRKTVFFTDIEALEVIRGEDYIYVHVMYTSLFRGSHKMIDISYKPQERRATVRADFDRYRNRWEVFISGIEYVHKPTIVLEPLEPDSVKEVEVAPAVVGIIASDEIVSIEQEAPKVEFEDFPSSIKRGKTLDLKWIESQEEKSRNLLLYLDGIKVGTLINDLNINEYQWQVPDKQSPGKSYQIGLTLGDSEEVYYSKSFKIKRKIPLGLMIIVPAAIIGGVTYWLLSQDKSNELPTPPEIQ